MTTMATMMSEDVDDNKVDGDGAADNKVNDDGDRRQQRWWRRPTMATTAIDEWWFISMYQTKSYELMLCAQVERGGQWIPQRAPFGYPLFYGTQIPDEPKSNNQQFKNHLFITHPSRHIMSRAVATNRSNSSSQGRAPLSSCGNVDNIKNQNNNNSSAATVSKLTILPSKKESRSFATSIAAASSFHCQTSTAKTASFILESTSDDDDDDVEHIMGYIKQKHNTWLVFDPTYKFDLNDFPKYDWTKFTVGLSRPYHPICQNHWVKKLTSACLLAAITQVTNRPENPGPDSLSIAAWPLLTGCPRSNQPLRLQYLVPRSLLPWNTVLRIFGDWDTSAEWWNTTIRTF